MKPAAAILTAGLAMLLAGCLVRGTPKTVQAAPAAPKPAVAPAPAAPPPPLSIPQTHVELPPPQPLTDEALATTQPPEEPAPTPPAPKPARPTRPAATHSEPAAQPPAVVGPPAEPAERPPVGELLSQEEQRQLLGEMQRARQDARRLLDNASAHRLNRQRQQLKQSVEQYLKLSEEAEKHGDLRQARELADRAAVLAKEIQP